ARRIDTVLRYYSAFLVSFPAMAVGFWLTKYWVDYIPKLYGPNVPIIEIIRGGQGLNRASGQRAPDRREPQEYRWAVRAADGENQAVASRLVGRDYQRYVPRAKLLRSEEDTSEL